MFGLHFPFMNRKHTKPVEMSSITPSVDKNAARKFLHFRLSNDRNITLCFKRDASGFWVAYMDDKAMKEKEAISAASNPDPAVTKYVESQVGWDW